MEHITAGSWPDWVAAVGTTAAFLVAAIAYARDVRARRWHQARLVYVRVDHIAWHAPGARVPLLARGAGIGFGDVAWLPVDGPPPITEQIVLSAAGTVTAAVHNDSDELFGPALVRAYGRVGPGTPWDFEVPTGAISPHASTIVELLCSNPHFPGGEPGLELEVTFRDAAGRWWQRRGYEPVRRAREKERETRKRARQRKRAT